MMNINDEQLNRFINNDLPDDEKNEISNAIEKSSEAKKQYHALLTIHNLLKNTDLEETSQNFTQIVMMKLHKHEKLVKQQKYFLITVLSFLGLVIMGILGFLISQVVSSVQPQETTEIVSAYSKSVGDYLSNLFDKKNLSILGSILSFIMLVSAYFLYEFQKRSKNNYSH